MMVDPQFSQVGRQLDGADDAQTDLVLTSVMGVKSPNTVLKRACALMTYYRWHAVHGSSDWLPFDANDVWRYVLYQTTTFSAASRSQSLVQALRFAHYVMGFDNALTCASSRKIIGQSQLQLAAKVPTRRARPLTVVEVKAFHAIADGSDHSPVDRRPMHCLELAACNVWSVQGIRCELHSRDPP